MVVLNLVLAALAAVAVARPALLPGVFLAALALLITSYLAAERVRPMWRSDAGSTKRAEATT